VTDESFIFASDPAAEFSKSVGLSVDLPAAFGTRTARYAIIVSKGVVKYIEKDASGVAGSGVDAVLAAL
jgi:alkyl hydroperoxide reductase 1